MAFSLTYTFSNGDVLDADELQQNFTDLQTEITSLKNENIAADASIAASKLANSYYEVCLSLPITDPSQMNTGAPIIACGGIPYTGSFSTFTPLDVEVTKAVAGAVSSPGDDVGVSVFYDTIAASANTIAIGTITGAVGIDSFGASGTVTLDGSKFFFVKVTSSGSNWAATDKVSVNIRLKAQLRT